MVKIHLDQHMICAHFCVCVTLQYKVKRKCVEGHACSKRKYKVLRMLRKGFLEVGSEESPEEARGRGWGGVRGAVPAAERQAFLGTIRGTAQESMGSAWELDLK